MKFLFASSQSLLAVSLLLVAPANCFAQYVMSIAEVDQIDVTTPSVIKISEMFVVTSLTSPLRVVSRQPFFESGWEIGSFAYYPSPSSSIGGRWEEEWQYEGSTPPIYLDATMKNNTYINAANSPLFSYQASAKSGPLSITQGTAEANTSISFLFRPSGNATLSVLLFSSSSVSKK
jgi:hypothetical protein